MNTIELKCVCNGWLGQKDAYVGDGAQDKGGISSSKYPIDHNIMNWTCC